MNNLNFHSDDQLHKFLQKKGKEKIELNKEIFTKAIHHLTDENKAEYFFDFEDRLIEEVVEICKNYPPAVARKCVLKIQQVVSAEIMAADFVKPYLKSLRNSIDGAVSAVLRFL